MFVYMYIYTNICEYFLTCMHTYTPNTQKYTHPLSHTHTHSLSHKNIQIKMYKNSDVHRARHTHARARTHTHTHIGKCEVPTQNHLRVVIIILWGGYD